MPCDLAMGIPSPPTSTPCEMCPSVRVHTDCKYRLQSYLCSCGNILDTGVQFVVARSFFFFK